MDLVVDKEGCHYSTNLNNFENALVGLFDKGIGSTQNVPQLEKVSCGFVSNDATADPYYVSAIFVCFPDCYRFEKLCLPRISNVNWKPVSYLIIIAQVDHVYLLFQCYLCKGAVLIIKKIVFIVEHLFLNALIFIPQIVAVYLLLQFQYYFYTGVVVVLFFVERSL